MTKQRKKMGFFSLVGLFLRELFRRAPRKETVSVRPKLDARLSYILSLSERKLRAIKERDDRTLAQRFEEIRERRPEIEAQLKERDLDEEAREALHLELEKLDSKLFAPLTSGIYFPGERKDMPFDEPYISAYILSKASGPDLVELGARVRSQAGDIFTAYIPLSRIPALESSPAVRFIELSRPLFPSLDETIPFTGIDTLHSATPAIDGTGVIIGVVDTELDIYHLDFRTPAGVTDSVDPTRVLFLWDQTLVPQAGESSPPAAMLWGATTYGVEYDDTAINSELANHDPTGTPPTPAYQIVRHIPSSTSYEHGTHVAGIAAGNGRQNAAYIGAAPCADIIYVRPGYVDPATPKGDAAEISDGFAYIFNRANALGQPCVVNMSSSDNQGPHDGTSLGEQFLDNLLLTPGRAITLSSGNTDNKESHAAGQVTAGATTNLVLRYLGFDTDADGIDDVFATYDDVIEIWYDGHDRFSATLTIPTTPPTVIGPVAPGTLSSVILASGVVVTVDSVLNDPRNGDNVISILIDTGWNDIQAGDWNFALTGTTVINGNFQAWIDRNNRSFRMWMAPHLQAGTLTVATPATARRPITVGNHRKPTAPGATPEIYTSSGRGPTRDGRIKPETATVGRSVMSVFSHNMNGPAATDFYISLTGTSMSAPLVAGACALLFQCRGAGATWADLKQILEETAGNLGTAAGAAAIPIPSNAFGFGYLQMAAACAVPDPDVDVWLKDKVGDTGIEPLVGGGIGYSPDIEVLDTTGAPVPQPTHDPTARYNIIIQVTVRNRGTQTARNTEVYFYWAEPSTFIPFPGAWDSSGIYTDEPSGFTTEGNKIVIPQLAAGADTQVRFAWAPPDPAGTLSGGDLCLLVRLENESDPSQIGAGGFSVVSAKNNIAQLNVTVQPAPAGSGDAEFSFFVTGSADVDGLIVESQLAEGEIELNLPARILPWRDIRVIEERATQQQRGAGAPKGCLSLIRLFFPGIFDRLFPHIPVVDPLERLEVTLEGENVKMRTDVEGAKALELREGVASIVAQEQKRLFATRLHLAEGEKHPVKVRVHQPKIGDGQRLVSVTQLSGGRPVGAVWLELRPPDEF